MKDQREISHPLNKDTRHNYQVKHQIKDLLNMSFLEEICLPINRVDIIKIFNKYQFLYIRSKKLQKKIKFKNLNRNYKKKSKLLNS